MWSISLAFGGIIFCAFCGFVALIDTIMLARGRKRWRDLLIAGVGCVGLLPLWVQFLLSQPIQIAFSGTYRGDNSIFVLYPNGTFQQRYTDKRGKSYVYAGRWSVSDDDETEVFPVNCSRRKSSTPATSPH